MIALMEEYQPGKVCVSPLGSIEEVQNIDNFVENSDLAVNEEGVAKHNIEWNK